MKKCNELTYVFEIEQKRGKMNDFVTYFSKSYEQKLFENKYVKSVQN